uniref:Uncharacterized protein n=1 Tax=Salix viminalis TaxID=40686 RepID=A0A6N2N2C1_SALVM
MNLTILSLCIPTA